MSRMKVHVGVVFTQAMFCDESGKIHYHKVMTDVDKPWVSVVKAITEVMPKNPIPSYHPVGSLNIQINFTNVHHSPESILEQLHYPEIYSSDMAFRFAEQEDVESLVYLMRKDWDENMLDTLILSELTGRMVVQDDLDEEPNDIKEVFHQKLARLYEGGLVWSAMIWDVEERMLENTS